MAARKKKTVKRKPAATARPKAGTAAKGKAKAKAMVTPKAKTKTKAKAAAPKAAVKAKAKSKVGAKSKVAAKTKPAAARKPAKASAPPRAARATTAAAASDSNRRRFDRRDTRIHALIEHDGGRIEGTVTNLSLQGCLFAPRFEIAPGARIRLSLAGKGKAVPATVKGVSDLGVHCLMHAGGATLGRLSIEHDDVALLMIKASRPHDLEPRPPAKRKG